MRRSSVEDIYSGNVYACYISHFHKGGEGKSTHSANLAGFFADAGLKTFLIDSDFAQPTASGYYSLHHEAPSGGSSETGYAGYPPLRTVEALPGVNPLSLPSPESAASLLPSVPVDIRPLSTWGAGNYSVTVLYLVTKGRPENAFTAAPAGDKKDAD